MKLLTSKAVTLCLDERWPRIAWCRSPDGKTRIPGEREAVPPRLYVFRKKDRAQLTSDDDGVRASYTLRASGAEAVYRASVTCDDRPAAEFEVVVRLDGADAIIRVQNVVEHSGYYLLTVRLQRVVAASSRDPDGRIVTCGWQGRVLDPARCKPNMTDYNWHGTLARQCGAAYRPGFLVTIDVPAYEDLFIQEVRQYSRIGHSETLASLGAELMFRRRTVEDPTLQLQVLPGTSVPVEAPDEPILSAGPNEIRLHAIAARKGRKLDWTDAAKYFQSLLAGGKRCNPLYNDTLISKCCFFWEPMMTFEQCGDVIRRIHHLTDGMKHICYFTGFQHGGGDSGRPDMMTINPAFGDKPRLRRVMEEARKCNTIVSFHDNQSQADVAWKGFDWDMAARDSLGRPFTGGVWGSAEGAIQLVQVSMPFYLEKLKKVIPRLIREYGIHTTYHQDTFGCPHYICDTHPARRFNATRCHEASFELLKEYNRHGIDVTVEGLIDPYVGRVGHVWCLFNYGTIWEGEEKVPFANFIYHGATSWNAGHAEHRVTFFAEQYSIEDTILGSLNQGGALGLTIPYHTQNPVDMTDLLYLVQPPYHWLRERKWTACRRNGSVHRVEYGRGSYIEVDPAKPAYKVVVDGKVMARDFTTVFPGPRKGTLLAYSRLGCDLDWPAPRGWRNGDVRAIVLTDSGPGVTVPARIEKGRLKLKLLAHQPVRLGPVL